MHLTNPTPEHNLLVMDAYTASRLSEDEARTYLEHIRWPSGPVCPHCGAEDAHYTLKGKAHRRGLYKCSKCRKQYSVTVGTVMHGSHIPMSKWVYAFHLLCASKKGHSAHQLYRFLKFGSYKTAWHLAHRVRLAMRLEPLASLLTGDVEVDETFVGGKPRKVNRPGATTQRRYEKRLPDYKPRKLGPAPDFKERKTPVLTLVERHGRVRAVAIPNVSAKNLREAMRKHVSPLARILTDERPAYRTIGREYALHELVQHSADEYVRGDVHVNTAESFHGLLKRTITGAYHHVSRKHLPRYVDEAVHRWNYRKFADDERAEAAMYTALGKRLQYRRMVTAGTSE